MHDRLRALQDAILRRPGRVLAGSIALSLLAAALGLGVEFRTSRRDLAPVGDPDQQRMDALTAEFGGSTTLIAAIEPVDDAPVDPLAIRRFVDAFAESAAEDARVGNVFCKVPLDWLLHHGFYLVPPDELERVVSAAEQNLDLAQVVGRLDGFESLNLALAERIERGLDEGTALPDERAVEGMRWLTEIVRAQRQFLEDPSAFLEAMRLDDPMSLVARGAASRASDTYLKSSDGRVLYVIINPASEEDSLPALRGLMAAMRARAERARAERPGFSVTFTGTPAITVEEMAVVRRDTLVAGGVAIVGVTLLTFVVFRWKSHALLVLIALAAGVLWSFGAVRLELGYLNMITSSFISTLVGVGVAYGIHPVSEYELQGAHTDDPIEAVRRAWHNTGAAVATAAVTTAAAFFSILLMRFPGFAEMGLVAGFGVLLCLLAALVTLPALVALYGRRRAAHSAAARTGVAGRRHSMVDRLWVGRASGAVCRFPRTVSLLALAVSLLALVGARGIGFNNNILEMLPANSDALRALRQMTEGSDLSPVFNMVVADDLEQLRALRDRAAAEPSIERFESVLRLLPEEPQRNVAALDRLQKLLNEVSFPAASGSVSREGLRASLERLLDAFDAAADSAFGAGAGELLEPLESGSAEVEAALAIVASAPASADAAWDDGQTRMHRYAGQLFDRLNEMVRAAPPELDGLPQEMKRRFVTGSGRLIGYLYPNGDVFDSELLEEYVAASRRVDPQAIGFPTMFWKTSHRITSGFYTAVLVGLVLVALILVIDYRNLRHAALAMIPLVMGIVWMLGGMRLLGLDFNFANLVAVPLIIGVGIDNGVHVIHRMRHEGEAGMGIVLQHTGRAILIAGLTTMIGFGSLALASHRGIQSLGLLLLLGVGACLLTATIVLPNLLVALGIAKR